MKSSSFYTTYGNGCLKVIDYIDYMLFCTDNPIIITKSYQTVCC